MPNLPKATTFFYLHQTKNLLRCICKSETSLAWPSKQCHMCTLPLTKEGNIPLLRYNLFNFSLWAEVRFLLWRSFMPYNQRHSCSLTLWSNLRYLYLMNLQHLHVWSQHLHIYCRLNVYLKLTFIFSQVAFFLKKGAPFALFSHAELGNRIMV